MLTKADMPPGSETLKLYNLERVRGYIERNPRCMMKECARDLKLDPRTVSKNVRIILNERKRA